MKVVKVLKQNVKYTLLLCVIGFPITLFVRPDMSWTYNLTTIFLAYFGLIGWYNLYYYTKESDSLEAVIKNAITLNKPLSNFHLRKSFLLSRSIMTAVVLFWALFYWGYTDILMNIGISMTFSNIISLIRFKLYVPG